MLRLGKYSMVHFFKFSPHILGSSPSKKHRNPSAHRAPSGRKAVTAPGKDRLTLPRAGQGGGGDDALSEASHSIKCE